MMLCANAVLSKQKAAVFGVTEQVLEASVVHGYELQQVWTLWSVAFRVCMKCDVSVLVWSVTFRVWGSVYMAEKRSCWGATRNNLIFNDVCIFGVGDPATLKMLNSFIVSLLRGAPYCLLFVNFFQTQCEFSLSCAGGILGRNKEKSENMRKFVSYSV